MKIIKLLLNKERQNSISFTNSMLSPTKYSYQLTRLFESEFTCRLKECKLFLYEK